MKEWGRSTEEDSVYQLYKKSAVRLAYADCGKRSNPSSCHSTTQEFDILIETRRNEKGEWDIIQWETVDDLEITEEDLRENKKLNCYWDFHYEDE